MPSIRELALRAAERLVEAWRNNQFRVSSVMGRMSGYSPVEQRALQMLLCNAWEERHLRGLPLPTFDQVELSVHSQNGEDGILLFLFTILGTTNKRAVEMCCGSGMDCNAANLIVNHGWEGLLFDGCERKLALGRRFFARCPSTYQWPPRLVSSWITPDNVNELIRAEGYEGEVDLFSLDMDGQDYWIWKSLTAISPRVMVVETHDVLGPDRALTVPRDPKFIGKHGPHGPEWVGASLAAFVKLGREKGYRLVGCQRYGYNVFFLRDDVGVKEFPEVDAASCFRHPRTAMSQKQRGASALKFPWTEV